MITRTKEFKLLAADTPGALNRAVRSYLVQGWTLHGTSWSVTEPTQCGHCVRTTFYQAVRIIEVLQYDAE